MARGEMLPSFVMTNKLNERSGVDTNLSNPHLVAVHWNSKYN